MADDGVFKVDTIFINGRIYTMIEEGDFVEAAAVLNGRTVCVGRVSDILKIPAKETVDLGGKTMLPAFTDTHCHLSEAVDGMDKIDLTGAASVGEIADRLKAGLSAAGNGGWIHGYQVAMRGLKEKRLPTRHDLDAVSTEVPIFLESYCLHAFMCNSKLLELAGIGKGFDKPGGEFLNLDENGEPTGVLREHGMLAYILACMPTPSPAEVEAKKNALEAYLRKLSGLGYTTVHTYDGFAARSVDDIAVYQRLEREGRLPMRVVFNREAGVDNVLGIVSGFGDEKLKYGSVKFFTDGCGTESMSFLLEDYEGRPGYRGVPIHEPEEYARILSHAYRKGNDIAVHAIGDAAIEMFVNVAEKIFDPSSTARLTLIHGTMARKEQLARLGKFGIVVATQSVFSPWARTSSVPLYGYERAYNSYPFRSMTDNGLILTFSDDGPIGEANPIEGINCAVLREAYEADGSLTPFNTDEAISVYEAVCAYTKNAAYAGREENIKGTVEVGKLADFVVLNKDIFTIPKEDIRSVRAEKTYLGGRPTV
jgi:predicted amidohydrolase YtcJ